MTSLLFEQMADSSSPSLSVPTPVTWGLMTDDSRPETEIFFSGLVGRATVSPTILNSSQSVAIVPSMLTDYYNRIFVIPDLIDVRNPAIGQPQTYSIWNAFFDTNTLENVVSQGDDGLTNTAVPPVAFRALEIQEFGIVVGPTAPLTIEATYDFDFLFGSGRLIFTADRANLIAVVPETPTRQEYQWVTDIIRSHDGSEQRISTRPKPRHILQYDIVLSTEEEIRAQRRNLVNNIDQPIILPLWHEPFDVTAPVSSGQLQIQGSFSLADFGAEDFVLLSTVDNSVFELARVAAIDSSTLTVDNNINGDYPAGSVVYPTVIVNLPDGSGLSRYPVNVADFSISGDAQEMRLLGGAGTTLPLFNGQPVLDIRPLNNDTNEESVTVNYERLDFGARFQVFSSQLNPSVSYPKEFLIGTRQELQFWKLFLDTVTGRQQTFYHPTFREDLLLASQPAQGTTQIILDGSQEYVATWFTDPANRTLVFNTADGDRQYRIVNTATTNPDGTSTLVLTAPLTDTPAGSTVISVELLQQCRLASDNVVFEHHGSYSIISLSFETTGDT